MKKNRRGKNEHLPFLKRIFAALFLTTFFCVAVIIFLVFLAYMFEQMARGNYFPVTAFLFVIIFIWAFVKL